MTLDCISLHATKGHFWSFLLSNIIWLSFLSAIYPIFSILDICNSFTSFSKRDSLIFDVRNLHRVKLILSWRHLPRLCELYFILAYRFFPENQYLLSIHQKAHHSQKSFFGNDNRYSGQPIYIKRSTAVFLLTRIFTLPSRQRIEI